MASALQTFLRTFIKKQNSVKYHPSIHRIIISLIFNLFVYFLYSQQSIYYNKTIDLGNNAVGALSVANIGTDNIIAATGSPAYTMRILRTDYWGNLKIEKQYSITDTSYYVGFWGSLSYDRNKNILDLGCNKATYSNGQLAFGSLMLLNTDCDSILEKDYKTIFSSSYLAVNMSRPTSDNGYVIIGDDKRAQYDLDITIIKTDSLGNVEWRQLYGSTDSTEQGYSIVQTNDGGYLLGGIQYKPGNDMSGETWIIKTDSIGNIEWDVKPGSEYYDRHAVVAQSINGNYIAGTTIGTHQDPGPPVSPAYRRINIMKINQQGQIIWQKAYGRSLQNNNLASLIELEDGSIVAVGYYDPYPEPFDKGWLIKVNQFGDSIWMREYLHYTENAHLHRLYDVDTTHDGGFVMAGQAKSTEPPNNIQRIWLLKVDSAGCDTAGCDPTVGIGKNPVQNQSLEMFPNPTSGNITIKTNLFKNSNGWIRIYDLFGRLQKSIEVPVGETMISVNLKGLKAGLHLVKVVSTKGLALSEKILIQ